MPGPAEQPHHPESRFRPSRPLVVGLVGGVAAGKSAVAAAFAARGLVHVDADQVARTVTARPEIVQEIASQLGPDLLQPDGALDRQKTAARVFTDPAARKQLEAITHPPVRAAILSAMTKARSAGASVLLDVPLLLEGGLVEHCDFVVFVHASDATRRSRAASRGWAEGEWQRREEAQATLDEKRARSDFLVDNDGPLEATQAQVVTILRQIEGAP